MKRQPAKQPQPNKDWRYSPPAESKDGKSVWIDAMQLTMITEHYRSAGIPILGERNES